MITIIAGSRDFTDYELLKSTCDKYNITKVVSGTCRGADLLGEKYAKENKLEIIRCPANWDKHGKSGGYIRNVEMANIAEQLIAFHKNGSKGTQHMINIAKSKNLNVIICQI